MTPSTKETEKIFRKMERDPARDAARSAYAKRVAEWKARWGFVDDSVLTGGTTPGAKGSRDDSEIAYGREEPVIPNVKRERVPMAGVAKSVAEFEHKRARMRAKFAIDRSSAIDHVTGEAYSRARRSQLEALTQSGDGGKPHYLASEYGMRTARDDKAELRSGLRIDHEQSAVYMRDNPGSTLKMFEELFKAKFPGRDLANVHFVNNPNIFDKVGLFFGADAVPPQERRRIDPIAPGIFAIDCPPPAGAEGFFDKNGRPAFESMLRSLGATPSSYQGFRALHQDDSEVPLSERRLGNAAAMQTLKESPSVRGLKEMPGSHPMANIAHTTAALLESLPGAQATVGSTLFDEATEAKLVESRRLAKAVAKDSETFERLKQTRSDPQRRKELQSAIATQGNRLDKLNGDLEAAVRARLAELEAQLADLPEPETGSDLEQAIPEIKAMLEEARKSLDEGKPGDADLALKRVPKRLNTAMQERYERDPMVQSALENIGKIAAGMEALVDDAARVTRLFDLLMDEVYVLLARSHPYRKGDFDKIMVDALGKRAPAVKALKNVKPKTFLVSSGMDALTTGMVAAMKNHGGDQISLSNKEATNTNYFEVAEVLKHKNAVADAGDVIMATLNPSTPTNRLGGADPDQVGEILTTVRKKLAKKAETAGKGTPAPISLVIDATIETASGGKPGTSELDRLIGELSGPIDAGLLSLVLCKSYQKYASLGSAKLMAGSVTVLGTDAAFEKGGEFAAASDKALDFRNNDESQLLAHLVSAGSGEELGMVKRAADNAKFVGAACIGNPARQVHNQGLPFVMFTPSDENNVKEALFKLGVENRDSFGFQNSSCLDVPGQGLRINTGQDPENALVEKFYAVGHLLIDTPVAGLKLENVNELLTAKRAAAAATAARLLAAPPERAVDVKNDKAAAEAMARRTDLQAVLAGVDPVAKQKALDAVAPLLPYYQAADPRPVERVELDNINAIEASCQALAATVLTLKPEEEEALAGQMKAFIDRGMKGVSAEMQGKIIAQWTRLAWKSPKAGVVDATAEAADKLPYKENRATLVIDGLPGAAVGRLPMEDRKKVLNATMKGLDIRSKLDIAETLIDANDLFKVEQILDGLKGPIHELEVFGKADPGAHESLGAKLGGDVAPDTMTAEERAAIAELYQNLRKRFAAAKPMLEMWAPAEDGSIAARCEAYVKILDAANPDDEAQVALLDNSRKVLERVRAGLDAVANATEVERINAAIDVTRRDRVFARKRVDAEMTKRIPNLRALIDGTDGMVAAANGKTAGLGDKLRLLATELREGESRITAFLAAHGANTKAKDEFEAFVESVNAAEKDVDKRLAAIAADDKDLAAYLKRLLDPHLVAEQRRLAGGYREKMAATAQIEDVLNRMLEAGAFLRGPVEKLGSAVKNKGGPIIGDIKAALGPLTKHKQYVNVPDDVKAQLMTLLKALPGWTD